MLALYQSSQALAALRGRTFVIPDDIKYLAYYVLVHRIIPKAESYLRGQSASDVLGEILDSVPVPVEAEVES
jgi:MoxR-like ATPase